jgi:hypothetical protein
MLPCRRASAAFTNLFRESPRRRKRTDLDQPLRADPLDPQQVVHRPVRPALDDPSGERGTDPREGFQLHLRRRVEVDQHPGGIRAPVVLRLRRPDLIVPAGRPTRELTGPRHTPGLPVADHLDRPSLVGPQQWDLPPGQERQRLGVRVPELVAPSQAGDGETGTDQPEPLMSVPFRLPWWASFRTAQP